MKRHPSLAPLSRDHHRALVEAKRLRSVAPDATDNARLALGKRLLDFCRSELEPHFQEEEVALLPLFARFVKRNDAELTETLLQHVAIRAGVSEVAEQIEKGSAPQVELLARIGDLLREHVRYEETKLFPAVETHVPTQDLERLLAKLEGRGASRLSSG